MAARFVTAAALPTANYAGAALNPPAENAFDAKRVTVFGLGRFGGGVGVTRWLAEQGARVTVTDRADRKKLAESVAALDDLDLTWHLGDQPDADFTDTDLLVANPAVPPDAPPLALAQRAGVPITTEINLFVQRCPARVVGVTGSVGKSTTCAMIGHLLSGVTAQPQTAMRREHHPPRRVWVGGNIGRSLLADLPDMCPQDVVVLELSSFQLERTPLIRWSPDVAVLTCVTPNHLDWHGDFAAYRESKLNIARFQDPQSQTLIVQDELATRAAAEALRHQLVGVWCYGLQGNVPHATRGSERVRWPNAQLSVPGLHNRLNAAAALTVAHTLGVDADFAAAALADFAALPHRLQRVTESAGVTYYDDSKSTTPESALTALGALDGPVLVILGGYDKGSDLGPLAAEAAHRAKFCACIGTTGPRLVSAIRSAGGDAAHFANLADAVNACRSRASAGDSVLLSPGCASWDQFPDFQVRGDQFAQLARATD
jgi:UDP-N-acetylmuramoylalanine--D-glutamate ligase